MRKKQRVANIIFGGIINFEYLFSRVARGYVTIIAYHRVADFNPAEYPYNEELISATSEQFREQVRFLKRRFNIISFDQLNRYLLANETPPPNSLIITFDDGYEDNWTLAVPILREFGVSATFFITVDNVVNNELFWFDKIRFFIKFAHKKLYRFSMTADELDITRSYRFSKSQMSRIVRSLSEIELPAFIAELEDILQTQGQAIEKYKEMAKPMSPLEVRQMVDAGMEIGSHTLSHWFLDNIEHREEIDRQLVGSKHELEKMIGRSIGVIAYPAGASSAVVEDSARDAGYAFGLGYTEGIYHYGNKFNIPRIHIDGDTSLPFFKACLLLPKLFSGS